jgi:fumarate reductase flavoprotein subunit
VLQDNNRTTDAGSIWSFETQTEPVPAGSIKQTIQSEVIVVGAGISGVAAALSAAEAGAKTILIEKTGTCQGRGSVNAFIDSRLQKKSGIGIDRNEVIRNLMKYGANKPDQRLLRMWAEGSGETADWLMNMTDAAGLEVNIMQFPPPASFDNSKEYYPEYLTAHGYLGREQRVVKCLLDNALQKGINVYFNTRAVQLLRKGNGRVNSIVAQNADGNYVQFNVSKAVVLCTGDYGHNPGIMAKYCPQVAHMKSLLPTSTGDGHLMAMQVGAVMEPWPHAPMSHGVPGPLGTDAFLQINLKGERFQNEDVPGQSYTNAIEHQPGKTAWQVFDSKYPEEVPYMGIGHKKILEATPDVRQNVEKQSVKADTIEELATKMIVPLETFRATVARYNELARMGNDLDFGKRPDRLTTIDKPPYYAGKGSYILLVVMGGLNVNTRLQVVDKDWNVITGLYLAGNVMGGLFAVDYPTMVPGLAHGTALFFGRIAGRNAATLEL